MCLSQSHPQYIRPWTFKGTIASCLEALYPLSKAPCCCCVPGMRSGGMTVGVAKAAGGEWALPAPGAGRRAAGGAIVHEYHCACPGQGAAAQRRGGGICACDFACHVYVRAAPPCHAHQCSWHGFVAHATCTLLPATCRLRAWLVVLAALLNRRRLELQLPQLPGACYKHPRACACTQPCVRGRNLVQVMRFCVSQCPESDDAR